VIDHDINPRKINENLIYQAAKEINKRNGLKVYVLNQQPICNIDRGFEKAISAHIVTIALNDKGKKYIGMNKKDYCFVEAQRNNYYIIF